MATVRLRIGPADQGRKMTLEEFWDAEEEPGYRYELSRGVLEVTQVPDIPHWRVVDNLHDLFVTYRRLHPGLIDLIGHGSDVQYVIPELGTDRNPDLAILFRDAPLGFKDKPLSVLAVEVVSPGAKSRKRDYEDKKVDYLAAGLLEYWIIDPDQKQVTVLIRREADDVAGWEEHVYRQAEMIVSGLLPGFAGTVADLWVGLDQD